MKDKISCICLTCGIRNDHTHPDGFCQNGHDDWLEYRDFEMAGLKESDGMQHIERAKKATGLSKRELTTRFMNPEVKHIPIRKP